MILTANVLEQLGSPQGTCIEEVNGNLDYQIISFRITQVRRHSHTH
jgi:hypothetical protein